MAKQAPRGGLYSVEHEAGLCSHGGHKPPLRRRARRGKVNPTFARGRWRGYLKG